MDRKEIVTELLKKVNPREGLSFIFNAYFCVFTDFLFRK